MPSSKETNKKFKTNRRTALLFLPGIILAAVLILLVSSILTKKEPIVLETESLSETASTFSTAPVPEDEGGTASESAEDTDLENTGEGPAQGADSKTTFDPGTIPAYAGQDVLEINGNVPFFTKEDTATVYVHYSELDPLGRCGPAMGCLDTSFMTDEKRPSITDIRPTGWHTVKYNGIEGNFLWNRGHLLAYAIAGKSRDNNSPLNLITMTRYLNAQVMLPYEMKVIRYLEDTGNRILYRVTPVFEGNDMVAKGVLMEAMSIEDDSLSFCVFLYNVQPGITIDYATGESSGEPFTGTEQPTETQEPGSGNTEGKYIPSSTYVLNTSSMKVHLASCDSVQKIAEYNRAESDEDLDALLEQGYTKCKACLGD